MGSNLRYSGFSSDHNNSWFVWYYVLRPERKDIHAWNVTRLEKIVTRVFWRLCFSSYSYALLLGSLQLYWATFLIVRIYCRERILRMMTQCFESAFDCTSPKSAPCDMRSHNPENKVGLGRFNALSHHPISFRVLHNLSYVSHKSSYAFLMPSYV